MDVQSPQTNGGKDAPNVRLLTARKILYMPFEMQMQDVWQYSPLPGQLQWILLFSKLLAADLIVYPGPRFGYRVQGPAARGPMLNGFGNLSSDMRLMRLLQFEPNRLGGSFGSTQSCVVFEVDQLSMFLANGHDLGGRRSPHLWSIQKLVERYAYKAGVSYVSCRTSSVRRYRPRWASSNDLQPYLPSWTRFNLL